MCWPRTGAFSNRHNKITKAIENVRAKLEDIEERLPEVDYEARDEEAYRKEKRRWHEEEKELIKKLPEAIGSTRPFIAAWNGAAERELRYQGG